MAATPAAAVAAAAAAAAPEGTGVATESAGGAATAAAAAAAFARGTPVPPGAASAATSVLGGAGAAVTKGRAPGGILDSRHRGSAICGTAPSAGPAVIGRSSVGAPGAGGAGAVDGRHGTKTLDVEQTLPRSWEVKNYPMGSWNYHLPQLTRVSRALVDPLIDFSFTVRREYRAVQDYAGLLTGPLLFGSALVLGGRFLFLRYARAVEGGYVKYRRHSPDRLRLPPPDIRKTQHAWRDPDDIRPMRDLSEKLGPFRMAMETSSRFAPQPVTDRAMELVTENPAWHVPVAVNPEFVNADAPRDATEALKAKIFGRSKLLSAAAAAPEAPPAPKAAAEAAAPKAAAAPRVPEEPATAAARPTATGAPAKPSPPPPPKPSPPPPPPASAPPPPAGLPRPPAMPAVAAMSAHFRNHPPRPRAKG